MCFVGWARFLCARGGVGDENARTPFEHTAVLTLPTAATAAAAADGDDDFLVSRKSGQFVPQALACLAALGGLSPCWSARCCSAERLRFTVCAKLEKVLSTFSVGTLVLS